MRFPTPQQIKSRDGTLARDSKLQNFMVDPIQPSKVQKRPSCIRTDLYAPAGQGFGSFAFGDYIYVWTDQNDPTYPAIYDYVPEYWGIGNGAGGGSGGYNIYWQNNNQYVEVPDNVFEELDVGDTVTISGVLPSGYNGSCLVVVDKKTAAQMGVGKGNSILITNLSNPGEVIQGGVAKKLRKCSTRPAFPKPNENFEMTLDQVYPLSSTLSVATISDTTTGTCPTLRTIVNELRVNGVAVLTGTAYQRSYSMNGCGNGATIASQSNWPGVANNTNKSWVIYNGEAKPAGSESCSDCTSTPARNSQVLTTVFLSESNLLVQRKIVYDTNKAAWDAMCCP